MRNGAGRFHSFQFILWSPCDCDSLQKTCSACSSCHSCTVTHLRKYSVQHYKTHYHYRGKLRLPRGLGLDTLGNNCRSGQNPNSTFDHDHRCRERSKWSCSIISVDLFAIFATRVALRFTALAHSARFSLCKVSAVHIGNRDVLFLSPDLSRSRTPLTQPHCLP